MRGLDFRDPVEGRKQNKEIAKSDTITDMACAAPLGSIRLGGVPLMPRV